MALPGIDTDFVRSCIARMVRPIVRLCLRRSLQLNDVIDILKAVFVTVAKEELLLRGEPMSLSRLSVMTGVHRKDVTRLERQPSVRGEPNNLIARIMVQWQHDSRFATAAKRPRTLSAEGRESEFAALVRSVNGADVSPYAVLHEMERLGAVERRVKTVKLVWRDFVSGEDIRSGLEMWAADTADLGSAIEENLFGGAARAKNLHLKTEFDNVVPEAAWEIRGWIMREGSAFHRRVREYVARFDRDLNPGLPRGDGRCRVAVGTFSLTVGAEAPERRTV